MLERKAHRVAKSGYSAMKCSGMASSGRSESLKRPRRALAGPRIRDDARNDYLACRTESLPGTRLRGPLAIQARTPLQSPLAPHAELPIIAKSNPYLLCRFLHCRYRLGKMALLHIPLLWIKRIVSRYFFTGITFKAIICVLVDIPTA